ncbi:hypothetical protein OPV22_022141 [Ensete ventricosum]|uniref:Uncharacterized protein n=1 Tax=Ensete ventricosum TaxID=4639 RepID=A0AAV8QEX6_ENSVE|nr:hypothetical protein OPV22_022141 [Ensete ventricosum]
MLPDGHALQLSDNNPQSPREDDGLRHRRPRTRHGSPARQCGRRSSRGTHIPLAVLLKESCSAGNIMAFRFVSTLEKHDMGAAFFPPKTLTHHVL